MYWRLQNDTYELGCYTRKPHPWLLKYRWIKRFVWFLDKFHSVYSLEEKPPDGYIWSGKRLTRKQPTSRPDHLWPELWRGLAGTQSWRRSTSGQLKNQSLIMQEDYKEFLSLTQRTKSSNKPLGMLEKLETPMDPAMPCKTCEKNKNGERRSKTSDFKSKFACILEASESTRLRMGESFPNHHEDHIAGNGDSLLQHYNLVHKFIPMPQAMKIPAAKTV